MMQPSAGAEPTPLVQPFPLPGQRIRHAYRELDLAANGTAEQRNAIGPTRDLPRPWIPATCTDPVIRAELWTWLDAFVVWHNHELVFDPVDVIPACWPRHPHLIHELAVLADGRYRGGGALSSESLEEWHRYSLPAFLERMRHRIEGHCTDAHPTTWPSAGRFTRHLGNPATEARGSRFAADLAPTPPAPDAEPTGPRLRVVDEGTGEILD